MYQNFSDNFAKMFDPQKLGEQFTQNFGLKTFDFSKFMDASQFRDLPKWWPDLKATNLNVSGVDVQALLENNKKNFDAITQANQVAIAGMQNLLRRQADIFRETMQTAGKLMADALATGTPEEKLARQADIAKTAFETAARNMEELASMVTQSQQDALKLINQRVTDSLDDLKGAVQKGKATTAAANRSAANTAAAASVSTAATGTEE